MSKLSCAFPPYNRVTVTASGTVIPETPVGRLALLAVLLLPVAPGPALEALQGPSSNSFLYKCVRAMSPAPL